MPEKTCFKCQRTLPLDEFYRHQRMGDGHLNKCKECTKKDVANNYVARRPQISEYEHERNQDPERRARKMEYQRQNRARNPLKFHARQAVARAIHTGKMQRQPCQYCGSDKAQAHHHDYAQPLDVVWACFKCHREHCHGQVVTQVDYVALGQPF